VLAARGQAQQRRGGGHEARDPGLDAVGVNQFGGAAIARPYGVGGVGGVDQLAGSGVGVAGGSKATAAAASPGVFFS
jgi:hypothetical protein